MSHYHSRSHSRLWYRILCSLLLISFLGTTVVPPNVSYALTRQLPEAGTRVRISDTYFPAIVRGLSLYPDNPLQFDFIIDTGDDQLAGPAFEAEAQKLIKYFLAALTVPEDELWVNLSPYEKDRVVPDGLGVTEMGMDMLAQDYLLKQISSSLLYPEEDLGKRFWDKVRHEARRRFGTDQLPVNTFNKVWVVPGKATVYEHEGKVFVVERHLKVMLEEDYLSRSKEEDVHTSTGAQEHTKGEGTDDLSRQVIREIILPELEKEVNEGKNFANLRQIYNSMILATWYKKALKESLLGQVYAGQNKTKGIDVEDRELKQKIYDQYLAAFKKGAFNYIKEDLDPSSNRKIPRKYFSGGLAIRADDIREIHGEPGRLPKSVSSALTTTESGEEARVVGVQLIENGTATQLARAGSSAIGEPRHLAAQPSSSFAPVAVLARTQFKNIEIVGEEARALFAPYMTAENLVMDMGEEYMIPALGEDAAIQAAGGLGFLSGEMNAALHQARRARVFSVTVAYKYTRDPQNPDNFLRVDLSKVRNVHRLMVRNEQGETVPYSMGVDFKGKYNSHPYGAKYKVDVYYVNNNGNLMVMLDVPDQPNLFHHLYDSFNGDENRWIQFGLEARMMVEFMKQTGTAPDSLRLNEGHMAFVYPAVLNDIDHHRRHGTRSIFEGIKMIFTNHTPEWAGIPQTWDTNRLRQQVGADMVQEYMLTDGTFNSLYAMVQNALNPPPIARDAGVGLIVNAVSKEHEEVLLNVILKQRFPDAHKVVTHIQNSSRAEDWMSNRLKEAIQRHGMAGITGKMLLDIADADKNDINEELRRLYGDRAPQFDDALLKSRPVIGFLRRWVEYKEAGVLLPLLKWITGDASKEYDHPVIPDEAVLNDPEKLEEFLSEFSAKDTWVRGPGLGMLVLAGGKRQGERLGAEWLDNYKALMNDADLKGRLVVVEDTGFPIMRLATAGSTFLWNVPDPTREASGTSQQRSGLSGKLVFAIEGAGMSAQIKHGVSGWIFRLFPMKTLAELMKGFDPLGGSIQEARKDFRARVPVLAAAYLEEAASMYYSDRQELEKRMLAAFRMAHDTVAMPRMVREYEALAQSLQQGRGKAGFVEMRWAMYIQALFENMYRWHPGLKGHAHHKATLRNLINEVWTPLDDLILGEDLRLDLTRRMSDEAFDAVLAQNGFARDAHGNWRAENEEDFGDRYLDVGRVASSAADAEARNLARLDAFAATVTVLTIQTSLNDWQLTEEARGQLVAMRDDVLAMDVPNALLAGRKMRLVAEITAILEKDEKDGASSSAVYYRDFYAVLQVGPGASAEEIKKAYRRLALEFHPDRHPNVEPKLKAGMEERVKEINFAYDILSDDQNRSAYDMIRAHGVNQEFSTSRGYEQQSPGLGSFNSPQYVMEALIKAANNLYERIDIVSSLRTPNMIDALAWVLRNDSEKVVQSRALESLARIDTREALLAMTWLSPHSDLHLLTMMVNYLFGNINEHKSFLAISALVGYAARHGGLMAKMRDSVSGAGGLVPAGTKASNYVFIYDTLKTSLLISGQEEMVFPSYAKKNDPAVVRMVRQELKRHLYDADGNVNPLIAEVLKELVPLEFEAIVAYYRQQLVNPDGTLNFASGAKLRGFKAVTDGRTSSAVVQGTDVRGPGLQAKINALNGNGRYSVAVRTGLAGKPAYLLIDHLKKSSYLVNTQGFQITALMINGGNNMLDDHGIEVEFPFVGRIAGGKFSRAGKEYDLNGVPGVDFYQGNAIGGMAKHRPWIIEDIGADEGGLYITGYFDTADFSEVETLFGRSVAMITYRLKGDELILDLTIEGEGELRFHPWIKTEVGMSVQGKFDQVHEDLLTDKVRFVPATLDLSKARPVDPNSPGGVAWDHTFRNPQVGPEGFWRVGLTDAQGHVALEMLGEAVMFTTVGVWNSWGGVIAIEPGTAAPNSVNHGARVERTGTRKGRVIIRQAQSSSAEDEGLVSGSLTVQQPSSVGEAPGGIDFNPGLLDLQIKRDANGVPLPLPQQPIQDMRIDGFFPVIINVAPVNVPLLLGMADPDAGTDPEQDDLDPGNKVFWFKEEEQLSLVNEG